MHISGSSSSTPFSIELFASQEQEVRFNQDFAKIRILQSYHLEEKVFKDSKFLKFEEAWIRGFICDIPKKMFSSLVKMFYSNRKYVGRIHSSELKKH